MIGFLQKLLRKGPVEQQGNLSSEQKYDLAWEFLEKFQPTIIDLEYDSERKRFFMTYVRPSVVAMLRQAREMEKTLNDINVFPVRDADTGSNILALISAVNSSMNSALQRSDVLAYELWQSLIDGLAIGSRGNSGLFLSSILEGVCDVLSGATVYDATTFALATTMAKYRAYAVRKDFVDGTIVTVAETIQQVLADNMGNDPQRIARTLIAECDRTVKNTPRQNRNLRGRVDAGALGLAELVKAIASVIVRGQVGGDTERAKVISIATGMAGTTSMDNEPVAEDEAWHEGNPQFCLTVKLRWKMDRQEWSKLSGALKNLGEHLSMVVTNNTTTVHVHTDNEDSILKKLSPYGIIDIIRQDMKRAAKER